MTCVDDAEQPWSLTDQQACNNINTNSLSWACSPLLLLVVFLLGLLLLLLGVLLLLHLLDTLLWPAPPYALTDASSLAPFSSLNEDVER